MTRTQKFYHGHFKTKETYNIEVTFEFDSDKEFSEMSSIDTYRYREAAYAALKNHPDYAKVDPIEVWFMDFKKEEE